MDRQLLGKKKLMLTLIFSVLSSAENEPSVQIIPKSSIYNVGDSKAIYCKGENLEEPLKWYGPDGKQIKGRSDAKSRVFVEKQNSNKSSSILLVLIQRAQLEDTGNWTCRSSNLESTISVLVGERAEIKPMEENVEGEEGSKVTLNCNARGKPRPDAQWYHGHGDPKEHRISEDTNPQKYVVERKGTNLALMIKNLNHNDSGEYICKVTQKALSYYTDSQVVLNVIHKPIIHLVHSTEVYALYNETKNITCSAKAFPAPEYAWYRRVNNFDEPIEDEGMIFTSEDKSYSVLILRVYSEEDLTEYKCTATNKKGSESVIFDVSLGNKPEPPDYVSFEKYFDHQRLTIPS
ncbi:Neural cell adhesion molecule 1 [Eumeta japonica]|uniref:Neural cell adhesion molecule 1 n=1 Tax=Eumeta variegata TaxID=151549 RepID=A0A4C1UKI7_EUMVA|nr:Neural cell adhesion molecule 1 [Eumeta japonica]